MVAQCDVVTINCPLHDKTRGLFDKNLISKMKKGSWLVNTARGAICDADAVAEALKSGHLNGYGGEWTIPGCVCVWPLTTLRYTTTTLRRCVERPTISEGSPLEVHAQ